MRINLEKFRKFIFTIIYFLFLIFIFILNHELGHIIVCKLTGGDVFRVQIGLVKLYPQIEIVESIRKINNKDVFAYITCNSYSYLDYVRISGVLFSFILSIFGVLIMNKYPNKKYWLLPFCNAEILVYLLIPNLEFLVGIRNLLPMSDVIFDFSRITIFIFLCAFYLYYFKKILNKLLPINRNIIHPININECEI